MLTHFLFLNTLDAFWLMAFFARFSVWHHSSHNPFAHFAFKVCYCFYCHCWRYYFVCLPVGMRVFVCVCLYVNLTLNIFHFFHLWTMAACMASEIKITIFQSTAFGVCFIRFLFYHTLSLHVHFQHLLFFLFDFEFSNGNFHGLTRKIGQTFAWQSRNR